MERLMAIRVTSDGAIDPSDTANLIQGQGVADFSERRVRELFGSWWEPVRAAADEEARRRALY